MDLYEATHDIYWLNKAIALEKNLEANFTDLKHGGFYMTHSRQQQLLVREKPQHDGAIPSGNSVATLNLLRLYEFTSNDHYRQLATKSFAAFSKILTAQPSALSEMLLAVDFYLDEPKEIVIITPENDPKSANELINVFRKQFLPNRVFIVVSAGKQLEQQQLTVPLVKNKIAQHNKATAYVCKQGVCELPTSIAKEFATQLQQNKNYGELTKS